MSKSFWQRPLTTLPYFTIISALIGCSGNTATDNQSENDESAASSGKCVTAPLYSKVSSIPGLHAPPFSSFISAQDNAAKTVGAWRREASPISLFPTNPNNFTNSPGMWVLDAPARGAYATWALNVTKADIGKKYSIYAYIPTGGQNPRATFRVYPSESAKPLLAEVNETKFHEASITLNGKTYKARDWWLLADGVSLDHGAHVSLDGSAGTGRTTADTIVAVRWGCAH